ncbi:hypothetical protein ACFQBU_19480, partial [Jhaorihella thermophila]
MRLLNVRCGFLLSNATDIEVFRLRYKIITCFQSLAKNSPSPLSQQVQRISARRDQFWQFPTGEGEQPIGVTLENKGKIPGTLRKRKIPRRQVA